MTRTAGPVRIVSGRGSSDQLDRLVDAKRAIFITSAGRSDVGDALSAKLGNRSRGVLALAKEHVPIETVRAAREKLGDADALVAVGGGSPIGLAKAVAVETGLPIIALPTTFSGSEMTPVFGISEGGTKKVGRDERARPKVVIYDVALAEGLPNGVAITSIWNAIAHAAEVSWTPDVPRASALLAEEAFRLLTNALRSKTYVTDDTFEGASLAGQVFGDVGSGIHHKLCHVLGGFGLPHAPTHAALIARVARWAGSPRAGELEALALRTGVAKSLLELGFDESKTSEVIEAILAKPPPSPRPIDAESLRELLRRACSGVTGSPMTSVRVPAETKMQPGFGGTHETEALPGALPVLQNTPRPSPYGLYPELLSGTPFTTRNVQNSRVWMYRVRPSFAHSAYRKLPWDASFGEVEPTRTRWKPLPVPPAEQRTDFVDGLVPLGGDGAIPGPGYLICLYAANADMSDRSFSSADGDLLIVPQQGTLHVRTELGFLRVPSGHICVIPRGIKFAIGLPDGVGRGWMCEVWGPRFRLPERGPIGSNGLADARHFLAPTASYEDRDCTFETVHKLGGNLFTATQAHSPFDVVAWHGVHVPFVYDMMKFNAMGSVTFDHVDPSIHTLLTTPFDDYGRAIVDFVVFRGRWDVAEHSFRPPYMHRNAASEINGVVHTDSGVPSYAPGCTFVSPLLTSHGISTASYDEVLEMSDAQHEGPHRLSDDSLWIMFESAMPFRLTHWARTTPLLDASFLDLFKGMKKRFDPNKR